MTNHETNSDFMTDEFLAKNKEPIESLLKVVEPLNKDQSELTPNQKELMFLLREDWLDRVCKVPYDEQKVKEGIEFLYGKAKRETPQYIIHTISPRGLRYAYYLCKLLYENMPLFNDDVYKIFYKNVEKTLRAKGYKVKDIKKMIKAHKEKHPTPEDLEDIMYKTVFKSIEKISNNIHKKEEVCS